MIQLSFATTLILAIITTFAPVTHAADKQQEINKAYCIILSFTKNQKRIDKKFHDTQKYEVIRACKKLMYLGYNPFEDPAKGKKKSKLKAIVRDTSRLLQKPDYEWAISDQEVRELKSWTEEMLPYAKGSPRKKSRAAANPSHNIRSSGSSSNLCKAESYDRNKQDDDALLRARALFQTAFGRRDIDDTTGDGFIEPNPEDTD